MVHFSWNSVKKNVNTFFFIKMENESQEKLSAACRAPSLEQDHGRVHGQTQQFCGLSLPRGADSPDTQTVDLAGPVRLGCVSPQKLCIEVPQALNATPTSNETLRAWLGFGQSLWQELDSSGPGRGAFPTPTSETSGAQGEGNPSSS